MSFKAELETLIAKANSSLEDLEAVLRRAQSRLGQGNGLEAGDGNIGDIRTELDTVRQKILTSLVEIQESSSHDQERFFALERELKLDLENIRQCAIDYFIKGQYRECLGLLTFLSKVQPYDENLANFLALSRRKQLENERQRTGAATDTQSLSENGNNEQQLSHEDHVQSADGLPNRETRSDDVEPPRPRAGLTTLPFDAANGTPPVFEPDPEEQSETLKPQILAAIELKTAAHIDETYRTPPISTKPRFVVWAVVAALGVATTIYWLSRSRMESFVPENPLGSQSSVEELVSAKDPLEGLRQEAQELFVEGKLQEAGRVCDAILSRDPQDSFAVSLRDTIRAASAKLKNPAEEAVPSEPTGDQSPETQSTDVQVRSRSVSSDMPLQPVLSTERATSNLKRIDTTIQKPSEQRPAGGQLTTGTGAAVTPTPVAPTRPAASQVAAVPQTRPDQLLELNKRIQAKDFDQARLLLERLESGFPGNPDVKALGEKLNEERGKQQSLASSWIEKADAAWIAGRYVTPPEDNVLVFCNLALKADPKHQRAANLKKETVQRAIAQAKDWIQRGKFDAARLSYASMDYLAIEDDAFPYSKQDLKRELEKLGFKTYSMIHDHRLGSCSGVLKFNAYAVAYVPSGDSGDGFSESLNSIVMNAEGERLRISYRDRTFRFRSENGNTVGAIYQQLMNRMTDERSILAGRTKETR